MKIIKRSGLSRIEEENLIDEILILKGLNHPNIINIFEYYQDSHAIYIVTELCTGGEVFDRIIKEKYFTENKAAIIMNQILLSVNYCHKNNIVHRFN